MSVNLLGAIADSIASFFHKILFGIIATTSRIVDVLINFIRIILGLDPLATNENTSISLFDNIVAVNVLQAFGICIAAGFAISLVFALVRAIKSHITEKEEEGVGLWKALRGFFVNAVSFLVIPFFAVCIILATGTVAKVVDNATQDGVSVRASYSSEVVFSTVNESMLEPEGNKWFRKVDEEHSLYYENGQPIKGMVAVKLVYGGWERGAKIYHADGSEFHYEETGFSGESDFEVFTDLVDEDAYFDTFILPLLGSCVMLVALAMSAVTIAQRIFSVVFLFILSPLPASFRAFDDGARFKKWAEIFIGKVLSGYGIVFALNVFFSLVPEFTKYDFFYDSFANGCAKLIIYIAGVSFAMGANLLISQFIGGDSLSSERDQTTQNFRAAMSGAHLAGSMTRMAGRATRFAFGHGWASPYGRYGSPYGGSPYWGSYYGSPFSGGGEVAQSIGGRMPQQASLGERSSISDSQQGMTAKGSATPLNGARSGSTPNGGYTARMMGGGLGQAGYDLMKGNAGSAAKHGAKNAGLSLGTTRIGRAVTGTAMFAAGLVTYTARAVGRGARGLWYNTFARNTAGAERYRAARSAAREERRISKAGARQTAFSNASTARQQKMLAKSQRAAERENVRRERTTAGKPSLNAQPNVGAQTGEQNPKRELGKRDLGKKQ